MEKRELTIATIGIIMILLGLIISAMVPDFSRGDFLNSHMICYR
jgi:hypothetical protein